MVRMTDLLKKAGQQLGVTRKQAPSENGQPPIPGKETGRIKKDAARSEESEKRGISERHKLPSQEQINFSDMLLGSKKEPMLEKQDIAQSMRSYIPDEEETKKLYLEAIEVVKKTFGIYKDGGKIEIEDTLNSGRKIVNNIILGSRQLLKLFHESDSLEFYTYYNAVNVSVLSVEIGIAYNYNKSTLLDLAMVGLLHDMDLVRNKDVIDKPEKLDEDRIKEIKKHPLNVALYVDNAFNFSKEKVNAVLQHHERKGGQGYPSGLTDMDIHDLAVIVGISDTYEAMTHSRPYRKKIPAHTAILSILEQGKELFPIEAIKALVSRVSLYPVGSWVELNTGEICRVLRTNLDSPLRPVVNILMDKERNKLREVRTIDLRKIPSLYITKEVTEQMDIEIDEEGGDSK